MNLLPLLKIAAALILLWPSVGTADEHENQTLWKSWYTVKVAKLPYQVYEESVELKSGKIRYQYSARKKEEGQINEEQIGTLSEGLPSLRPVLYNFRSTYRKTEKTIDGTIKDDAIVTKLRTSTEQLSGPKRILPKKAIFASLFPLWLAEKIRAPGGIKPGKLLTFTALVEDTIETSLIENGRAYLQENDEIANQTGTKKFKVQFRGNDALWWIKPNGMPLRIEIPAQKVIVQTSTEEEAQNFLK